LVEKKPMQNTAKGIGALHWGNSFAPMAKGASSIYRRKLGAFIAARFTKAQKFRT